MTPPANAVMLTEQRRAQEENRFWSASKGRDVCAMQALKGGRISHYFGVRHDRAGVQRAALAPAG